MRCLRWVGRRINRHSCYLWYLWGVDDWYDDGILHFLNYVFPLVRSAAAARLAQEWNRKQAKAGGGTI